MKCNFKKVESVPIYNVANKYMGDNVHVGNIAHETCLLKQGFYNKCDGEKKCIFHIHNNQLIIEKKTNTGMSRCKDD